MFYNSAGLSGWPIFHCLDVLESVFLETNDPYLSDSTLRIVIPRDRLLVLHVESLFLETSDPCLPSSTLKKRQMTPPYHYS